MTTLLYRSSFAKIFQPHYEYFASKLSSQNENWHFGCDWNVWNAYYFVYKRKTNLKEKVNLHTSCLFILHLTLTSFNHFIILLLGTCRWHFYIRLTQTTNPTIKGVEWKKWRWREKNKIVRKQKIIR